MSKYVSLLAKDGSALLRGLTLEESGTASFLNFSSPPAIDLASMLGHRARRVDNHLSLFVTNTKLWDERSIINSPAHYTERYSLEAGGEIVLHVYFDINGRIITHNLKLNENQILITPKINEAISKNLSFADKLFNAILTSRVTYIDALKKRSEKLQMQLITYKNSQSLEPVLQQFIQVVEELNSLYFGYCDTRANHAKSILGRLHTHQESITQATAEGAQAADETVEDAQAVEEYSLPTVKCTQSSQVNKLSRISQLLLEFDKLLSAAKKTQKTKTPEQCLRLHELNKKLDEVVLELTFLDLDEKRLEGIKGRIKTIKKVQILDLFEQWVFSGNTKAVQMALNSIKCDLTSQHIMNIILRLINMRHDINKKQSEALELLFQVESCRNIMSEMNFFCFTNSASRSFEVSIIIDTVLKRKYSLYCLLLKHGYDVKNGIGLSINGENFSIGQALALLGEDKFLKFLMRHTTNLYLDPKFQLRFRGSEKFNGTPLELSGLVQTFDRNSSCLALCSRCNASPEVIEELAEQSNIMELAQGLGHFVQRTLTRIIPSSEKTEIFVSEVPLGICNHLNFFEPGREGFTMLIHPRDKTQQAYMHSIVIMLRCLTNKVREITFSTLDGMIKQLIAPLMNMKTSPKNDFALAEAARCLLFLTSKVGESMPKQQNHELMIRQRLMQILFIMGLIFKKRDKPDIAEMYFYILLDFVIRGAHSSKLCNTPLYQKALTALKETPRRSYYELFPKLQSRIYLFPNESTVTTNDTSIIVSDGRNNAYLLVIKSGESCLAMSVGEDTRYHDIDESIRSFCKGKAVNGICIMGGGDQNAKTKKMGIKIKILLESLKAKASLNLAYFQKTGNVKHYAIDPKDMSPHLVRESLSTENNRLSLILSENTHLSFDEGTGTKLVRKDSVSDELEEEARQMIAACEAKDLQRLVRIIEYGINANNVMVNGTTVLHAACKEQWYEGAELLIFNGANIHKKDSRNRTPLQLIQDGEKREKLLAWWYTIENNHNNERLRLIDFSVYSRNQDVGDEKLSRAGLNTIALKEEIGRVKEIIRDRAKRGKYIQEVFEDFISRHPSHDVICREDNDWNSDFFRLIHNNCPEATLYQPLFIRVTPAGTLSTIFSKKEEEKIREIRLSAPRFCNKRHLQKLIMDVMPDVYLIPIPSNLYHLLFKCANMGIGIFDKPVFDRAVINHQIICELYKRKSLVITLESLTKLAADLINLIRLSHRFEEDYVRDFARVLSLEIKFMFSGSKWSLLYANCNSPMEGILRLKQQVFEFSEIVDDGKYALFVHPQQISDDAVKIEAKDLIRQLLVLDGFRTAEEWLHSTRLNMEGRIYRQYVFRTAVESMGQLLVLDGFRTAEEGLHSTRLNMERRTSRQDFFRTVKESVGQLLVLNSFRTAEEGLHSIRLHMEERISSQCNKKIRSS